MEETRPPPGGVLLKRWSDSHSYTIPMSLTIHCSCTSTPKLLPSSALGMRITIQLRSVIHTSERRRMSGFSWENNSSTFSFGSITGDSGSASGASFTLFVELFDTELFSVSKYYYHFITFFQ